MRKLITMALLAALLASAATGDTVYMRDGRELVGKVTKVGEKLKIKTPLGVIVVDQADVFYVAYGVGEATPPTTGRSEIRYPSTSNFSQSGRAYPQRYRPLGHWRTHPRRQSTRMPGFTAGQTNQITVRDGDQPVTVAKRCPRAVSSQYRDG